MTKTKTHSLIKFDGKGFTDEELGVIRKRMTPEMDKQRRDYEREVFTLETALTELRRKLALEKRAYQATPQFQRYQNIKREIAVLEKTIDHAKVKAAGIWDTLLNGIRKGNTLARNVLMLMASEEEL